MENNLYDEILLENNRDIIELWTADNTLVPICFEDVWFYYYDEDENEKGTANGSLCFNPADNSIVVIYDYIDASQTNNVHTERQIRCGDYHPIIVKTDFYTTLTVNDSETSFFTDDDEKTTQILIYIKYWNHLRKNKLLCALDVVKNASLIATSNTELVNATNNFIEMLPLSVFINPYFYVRFNYRHVGHNDDLVDYFEDFGDRAKELAWNWLSSDSRYTEYVADVFNEYVSYSNVIRKYIDVQEEYKDSVIKVLFRNVVYEYFSLKWESLSKERAENYSTLEDYIMVIRKNYEVFLDDDSSICFLAFYLCKHNFYGQEKYPDCRIEIDRTIETIEEENKKQRFEQRLFHKNSIIIDSPNKGLSISDIDLMSGKEFEMFVADMFKKMGYSVNITKESGDQGIDVIAEHNGSLIGIQAKCYSSTVGNYAVQEAVAGGRYYQCNKSMVITNRYFTESAISLASVNEVVLWDRDMIIARLAELYK